LSFFIQHAGQNVLKRWLQRFTHSQIASESGWHQSLLLTLPFAALAFFLGMVFDLNSGNSSAYDRVAYPLLGCTLVLLEALLLLNKRFTTPAALIVVNCSGVFFLSKLTYLLFLTGPQVNVPAEMTESMFWVPATYILGWLVPGATRFRWLPLMFVGGLIALILSYFSLHAGQPDYAIFGALTQLGLSNLVLLGFTSMLLNLKDRFVRTEAHADAMQRLAYTDQVTGLPNRTGMQHVLEATLRRAAIEKLPVSLVFLDLDGFKVVNDTLGHDVGDEVLLEIGRRWKTYCRNHDHLGRWSGDEFVMVLWNTPGDGAAAVAERLIWALSTPLEVRGSPIRISASAGVSSSPDDTTSGHELLQHADSALYTVKRNGKNGVRRFSAALDSEIEERHRLESDLRRALERSEFELVYQPILNLQSQEIIKVEALLRWRHPERGVISPAQFIPVAEESGLIVPIGTWVMQEACRQAKVWNQPGHPRIKVAVNVASLQLAQPNFKSIVAEALVASGLPASLLELELTEGVVMRDIEHIRRTLNALRELGISLSIDDFGTGYSSLSYLRDLPIQTIKIDRSFIRDLGTPRHAPQFALALIEAIMSIALALDLEVVAEGIETEAQAVTLRGLGCEVGQGYLFARPESAHLTGQRLTRRDTTTTQVLTTSFN
jgi:diguanylate cyclase (GGDEF)-like protein